MFFIIEFLAKLTLAPRKPVYLRRHWFDALVALIPIAGILRVIESAILAPLIRLLLGKGEHPQLTILAKRKLDQLAIISALIILIAAVLAYMFENGARGSPIQSFGDALWWAAATATTVGNQLYPVTVPGEILAFCLMLFALVVFSYLTSSIASAVIGGDAASAQADPESAQSAAQADEGQAGCATQLAQQATQSDQAAQAAQQGAQAARQDGHAGQGSIQITLSADELATLRAILARAGGQTS
jgi:voltage-gated potassium channel